MKQSIILPNSFMLVRNKSQMFYLLFFIQIIFSITNIYGQTLDSNNKFIINGELTGRDSGTIVLWYTDHRNTNHADTAKIVDSKFHFTGTVNGACEAILWTNIQNKNFDDPSVVRFILQPNIIFISKLNDSANAIITGSESQFEKEKWDEQKTSLQECKNMYYNSIDSLKILLKSKAVTSFKDEIKVFSERIDSINARIRELDVDYIVTHPNSYLSAYLLARHSRRLIEDSVKNYFSAFSNQVKNSSLGYDVLKYIYPLSNDQEFRMANPLLGKEFNENLSEIKSLHDFSLIDTSGNKVDFRSFNGKYLVIDFWASWCIPCLENIPAWNKLIKIYNTDSIQFISISLDNDINKWKQSIIKHKHTGIQVIDLKAFNSLIAVYGKVLWLPRYIIADQNGQIINYKAPRPGDPELRTLLDSLIK